MESLLPYLCMVTVPHIMVRLERMLDYRGVGLERFHCTNLISSGEILYKSYPTSSESTSAFTHYSRFIFFHSVSVNECYFPCITGSLALVKMSPDAIWPFHKGLMSHNIVVIIRLWY